MVKNLSANAGDVRDVGFIPTLGRSPEEGRGNPLQYSCLENPMDRGAWWATIHGVSKSQIRLKCLSTSHIQSSFNLEVKISLDQLSIQRSFYRELSYGHNTQSNRLRFLTSLQSCQPPLSQNAHVSLFLTLTP